MIEKLIVIVLSLLCQSWACKLVKYTKDVQICESWEEFTKAGIHPEWKQLVFNNTANLEKIALKNGAFKNVSNLENLYIKGLVNTIEAGVFKDLPNLKKLHLIDNLIEKLPEGIFTGLNLNVLEIKNSYLKTIYPGTLDKINFLNLEGNQIIPGTMFRNTTIQLLNLSNNSISNLEDCAFCETNLRFLNLQENSLTSFDPVKIFGENSPIMGIALDNNNLTKIPKFEFFPNLHGLSVANNTIEKIENGSFAKCPKFSLLDVGYNNLKEIPANIFIDGDEAEPLYLSIQGNQIQCLSKELREKIKILNRVVVNDNPWKCECLDDVLAWAINRNASVGCELPTTCNVPCVDKNNKQQIISLPSEAK